MAAEGEGTTSMPQAEPSKEVVLRYRRLYSMQELQNMLGTCEIQECLAWRDATICFPTAEDANAALANKVTDSQGGSVLVFPNTKCSVAVRLANRLSVAELKSIFPQLQDVKFVKAVILQFDSSETAARAVEQCHGKVTSCTLLRPKSSDVTSEQQEGGKPAREKRKKRQDDAAPVSVSSEKRAPKRARAIAAE